MLRLDWGWCNWRTSAKGHCRIGLQVWRRQVGLVRGTRWPAGSSAGRMVARTARSWTVSWLSLKTKVDQGLHGSRVMGGDWRRLHRVRGVSSGSLENCWVPWLIHKAKTEDWRPEVAALDWSDQWGTPIWPVCGDAFRRVWSRGHTSGLQGLRRG
jgi:hypothetical protein